MNIFQLIEKEKERQLAHIELIASENYVSDDVLKAQGSILTNKYAEGYPSARYYGGCEVIDQIEQAAIDLAKELFQAEHANVQPHCGSSANMAVYLACLKPYDVVLGMDLNAGGHLTHGSPYNFSGQLYRFESYGVDPKTELIDYEAVRQKALVVKPKLIVAGASAYSRIIDFKKFREIADEVNAYLMVDMAHIAGLVATGFHPSPVPYADFVTTTTHKTLRGPRAGLILCKKEWAKKIDKAVFPGSQGGPLEHIIAAKAVCFQEALQPFFKKYIAQVIKNTKVLADELKKLGFRIVSETTDNHLVMIDVYSSFNLTGKFVETRLNQAGITTNKNTIPFDSLKTSQASGIRLGAAAMTTRGFKEKEFKQIAQWIYQLCQNSEDEALVQQIHNEVVELCSHFELVEREA